MSFDLALAKGDLAVGADGDIRKVRQGSKLTQDVLKVLHTPLGSDPFFPTKGSTLTEAEIGKLVNRQFVEDRAEASILASLQAIQAIQEVQKRVQEVTPEETLVDIQEVNVEQDELDPRQYNISITVLTGAFSTIELPDFQISTQIS